MMTESPVWVDMGTIPAAEEPEDVGVAAAVERDVSHRFPRLPHRPSGCWPFLDVHLQVGCRTGDCDFLPFVRPPVGSQPASTAAFVSTTRLVRFSPRKPLALKKDVIRADRHTWERCSRHVHRL